MLGLKLMYVSEEAIDWQVEPYYDTPGHTEKTF